MLDTAAGVDRTAKEKFDSTVGVGVAEGSAWAVFVSEFGGTVSTNWVAVGVGGIGVGVSVGTEVAVGVQVGGKYRSVLVAVGSAMVGGRARGLRGLTAEYGFVKMMAKTATRQTIVSRIRMVSTFQTISRLARA